MLSVSIRTLKHHWMLDCEDAQTARDLAAANMEIEIEGIAPTRRRLRVEHAHGFLRLTTPSGPNIEGSAAHLLRELDRSHFSLSRAEYPDAVVLRAGALTLPDGHLVLAAEDGAGGTTLLAGLLADGWRVTGDSHVIVRGQAAAPRPRPFYLKAEALVWLDPRATRIIRASASPDQRLCPFQPAAFGQRWVIRFASVRHLLVMDANFGGRSRLRLMDKEAALKILLSRSILPRSGKALALVRLHSLVAGAQCWHLRHGDQVHSRRLIAELLTTLGYPPPDQSGE